MKLPELLDSAFRRLFDHYAQLEEENGRARQSLQAPFEAQMKQLQYSSRHRAMIVSRSWTGSYRVRGTDLGCGCTAHCYHPARPGGRDYDGPDVHLDRRPDPVSTALRALDEQTQFRLARLARVMLPEHSFAFGRPFKSEGGSRYLAPLRGVAQEPSRGPGTIADLSDTPRRLWGARAPAELERLAQRLRMRCRCESCKAVTVLYPATVADRELWRRIRGEAEADALDALTRLDNAMHPLAAIRRAGQRERAAA